MRQLNLKIGFDPSPSASVDLAVVGNVVPGHAISWRSGPPRLEPGDWTTDFVPRGQCWFSIVANEGNMVEAFISYRNSKGKLSQASRLFFKVEPDVAPEPPSRLRVLTVTPVMKMSAPETPPGVVPVNIPDQQWIAMITEKSGDSYREAVVMSVDDDGRGLHVMFDENSSAVIYAEDYLSVTLRSAVNNEKLSIDEFLQRYAKTADTKVA